MNATLKSHIRMQSRLNFIINLVLNGAIAWFLLKDKPALSAWGEHGYGADLMITGFLLASLVALFAIKGHRSKLAKGQHEAVPPAELGAPLPPFSPPAYAVFKGVWAGILAALVIPPAIKLGLRAA